MCFLTCVIHRFTFGVTPANCIEVSIVAKPFQSHVLADVSTSIGGGLGQGLDPQPSMLWAQCCIPDLEVSSQVELQISKGHKVKRWQIWKIWKFQVKLDFRFHSATLPPTPKMKHGFWFAQERRFIVSKRTESVSLASCSFYGWQPTSLLATIANLVVQSPPRQKCLEEWC